LQDIRKDDKEDKSRKHKLNSLIGEKEQCELYHLIFFSIANKICFPSQDKHRTND